MCLDKKTHRCTSFSGYLLVDLMFCLSFLALTILCYVPVGNHYMYGEQKNFTRAMDYLLKAAAHRSDDAHFSLAMLYRYLLDLVCKI